MTNKSRTANSVTGSAAASATATPPPTRRTSKATSSSTAGVNTSTVKRSPTAQDHLNIERKTSKLQAAVTTTTTSTNQMKTDDQVNHGMTPPGVTSTNTLARDPAISSATVSSDKDKASRRARIPFALARDGLQNLVKSPKQFNQQQRKQIKEAQELQVGQVKSLVLGQPLWQNDPRDLVRGGTVQLSFDRIEYSPSTRGRITSLVRKVRKGKLVLVTSLLPHSQGDSVQSGGLIHLSKSDGNGTLPRDAGTRAESVAGASEGGGRSPSRMRRLSGRMNKRLSGRFAQKVTTTSNTSGANKTAAATSESKSLSISSVDRTRSYASLLRSLSPLASTNAYSMPESDLLLKWTGLGMDHSGPVWTPVLRVQLMRVSESGHKEVIGHSATEVGSLMSRKRPTSIHKGPHGLRAKLDTIPLLLSADSRTVVGFVTIKAVWHPNERRQSRRDSRRRSSRRNSNRRSSSHSKRKSKENEKKATKSTRVGVSQVSAEEGARGEPRSSSFAIRKDVAHTARIAAHKKQTAKGMVNNVRIVTSAAEALILNTPGSEGMDSVDEESSEDSVSSASGLARYARKKQERRGGESGGVGLGPMGAGSIDMGSKKKKKKMMQRRPTLTSRLAMPEDSELDLSAAEDLPEPSDDPMRGRADSDRRGSVWSDWGTADPATPVYRNGWTRFFDEQRGIHYFYNEEEGTTWRRPAEWTVSSGSGLADTVESLWIVGFSEKHQASYWYNTSTKESVWDEPDDAPPAEDDDSS